MKRKSILSLALMSFFAPSIFAEGVSSDEKALETTTITGLGETVGTFTYTDSKGNIDAEFDIPEGIKSDFSVSKSTSTDWLGYQTIEKFLLNTDGTYTSIYLDMNINDFGDSDNNNPDSSTGTASPIYTYVWNSKGELVNINDLTDSESYIAAFTVYSNKYGVNEDGDGNHVAEEGTNGAGDSNSNTGVSYAVSFIENTASNYGGGIYNMGTLSVKGEFIGNTASSHGGGIYNGGTITSITGDFILNSSSTGGGGAIYNNTNASIETIIGDFIANSANTFGGAINNSNAATIDLVIGDFIGNSVDFVPTDTVTTGGNGGAIYNTNANTVIGTLMGNFIGNSASSAGGAIANTGSAKIYSINGDFIANTAGNSGGAIYNYNGATIDTIIGDFVDNCSDTSGGAIFNNSTISSITGDFISNYAKNYGGAIYNNAGTISLYATSSSMVFEGNYTDTGSNAIYNNAGSDTATSTINFTASGDNTIVVNDGISGVAGSKANQILNINGGTVEFNNSVYNNTVNVAKGATLSLGSYAGGMEVTSDYKTEAAVAELSNVALNVTGTLNIDNASADSTVKISNSSFIMATGSSIFFSAYSSLTLESSTEVSIGDLASVIIDLSGYDIGNYSYTLIYTDDTSVSQAIYEALINENITVQTSTNVDASDILLNYDTTGANLILSVVLTSAAVPEPSTYAMIFGVVALGFASYRRRKQN